MMRFFVGLIFSSVASSSLSGQILECTIDDGISVYRETTGQWRTHNYAGEVSPEALTYRLEINSIAPDAQVYELNLTAIMGQVYSDDWMCDVNSLAEIYLDITCINHNGTTVRINPDQKRIISWFESLHYLYGVTGNYDGSINWVDGDYDLYTDIGIGTCRDLNE